MSHIILEKIIASFGLDYSYKNAVKPIKIAGGKVLKVTPSNVTFIFPDKTTLTINT